jgi:hypothetical protein
LDFDLAVTLTGGKTYTIELYSSGKTGGFSVFVTKAYSINVDSTAENGRIWIENADYEELTVASVGEEVLLGFSADSGYALDNVTVTDENGNPIDISSGRFLMPSCDITVTGHFGTNSLGVGENAAYVVRNNYNYYTFTPSVSGEYRFYSVGGYDPMIEIYCGTSTIDSDDDSGNNKNFDLTVDLTGGETYTIELYSWNNGGYNNTGPMTMYIEKFYSQYDMNEDGVEDVNDIGFIISASAGLVDMTSSQEEKADLNGDGVVDAFDAAWLDRYWHV